MTQPAIFDPRLRGRVLRLLQLALALTWLSAAAITHLPGPSASDDPATRSAVRSVWVSAGERLQWLGSWVPDLVVEAARPLISDKTVHFGLWLAMAFFWASYRALRDGLSKRDAGAILAALALYAVVSELAQSLMGRYADVGDLVANLAGAVVGVGGVWLAQTLLRARGLRASS